MTSRKFIPESIIEFFRNSNLGTINGQSLTSLLPSLNPSPVRGNYNNSTITRLVEKYFEFAQKRTNSVGRDLLILSPEFIRAFRSILEANIRKTARFGNDPERYIREQIAKLDNLTFEGYHAKWMEGLIRDSAEDKIISTSESELNQYLEYELDLLFRPSDEYLLGLSQGPFRSVSVRELPPIFSSGRVADFKVTDLKDWYELEYNQLCMIRLQNDPVTYFFTANYNKSKNDLQPPYVSFKL